MSIPLKWTIPEFCAGYGKRSCWFLWFATKDGLCRFDGYSFVNYKATTKQFHCSINNQFVQLVVDKYGFLWVRNSMGQAFCFNPHIHTFELFPNMAQNRGENLCPFVK